MRVTLTFDNGPDPEGTPAALAALAERNISAVFFVIGQRAHAYPELVSRTRAAGHLVGNHTWSHSLPFGESTTSGFARSEILRTQEAIHNFAVVPPLFRPIGAAPGAIIDDRLLNEEALQTLIDGRYTTVLWNVVPRDWERPHDWADGGIERCRQLEHAVVVLHDGYPAGMDLLPAFLDSLIAEGVEFRTDFPSSCTPIRAGIPEPEAAALVMVTAAHSPAGPARIHSHSSNTKEQS